MSIRYAADDFTVRDASGELLFEMVGGASTYCADGVTHSPSVGYVPDAEPSAASGMLALGEGRYEVAVQSGTVAFCQDDDYCGVVCDSPITATNTSPKSIELTAGSKAKANVVVEDIEGGTCHSIATDVEVGATPVSLALEGTGGADTDRLVVEGAGDQTLDVRVENVASATDTEGASRTYEDVSASQAAALDLNVTKSGDGDSTIEAGGNTGGAGDNPGSIQSPKAGNPMTAKAAKKSFKVSAKKLKKKAQKVAKPVTVKKAQGKVTYAKASTAKKLKKFKVDKASGKVTVPKKTKKGTYKLAVTVSAAGNDGYNPATKRVTLKIVVK